MVSIARLSYFSIVSSSWSTPFVLLSDYIVLVASFEFESPLKVLMRGKFKN